MGKHGKPRREGSEPKSITIGALSRATRIPTETLRTWERRYGSPMPVRKPSGHRIYPAASVEHLRRVGQLLDHGHRPGEILGLSLGELDHLLSISDSDAEKLAPSSQPTIYGSVQIQRSLSTTMRAVMVLDRDSMVHELRANWTWLGPLRFLQEFAGPLMINVGRAWRAKTSEIRHEHFAFSCMSGFLREVREPFDREANGPRVVASTLPGDLHEGGLLMFSALLAYRGYRVVYLGVNTPVDQLIEAAKKDDIELVAVSVSLSMPRRRAAATIEALRKELPQRMPLWIGGAGAPAGLDGVEHFTNLDALDERLSA